MSNVRKLLVLGLALGALVVMTTLTFAQGMTPSVSVADQPIVNGTVTIAEVVSDGPGWLVIHAQKDGKPGPVLGWSPVSDGVNTDVVVKIDVTGVTETLYAMLHTDAGTVGTYEFPGADVPVKVGDKIVTPPFKITGGLPLMMPKTGAAATLWTNALLLLAGTLAVMTGLGLTLARRTR